MEQGGLKKGISEYMCVLKCVALTKFIPLALSGPAYFMRKYCNIKANTMDKVAKPSTMRAANCSSVGIKLFILGSSKLPMSPVSMTSLRCSTKAADGLKAPLSS